MSEQASEHAAFEQLCAWNGDLQLGTYRRVMWPAEVNHNHPEADYHWIAGAETREPGKAPKKWFVTGTTAGNAALKLTRSMSLVSSNQESTP